jgi:hypothetical protein
MPPITPRIASGAEPGSETISWIVIARLLASPINAPILAVANTTGIMSLRKGMNMNTTLSISKIKFFVSYAFCEDPIDLALLMASSACWSIKTGMELIWTISFVEPYHRPEMRSISLASIENWVAVIFVIAAVTVSFGFETSMVSAAKG